MEKHDAPPIKRTCVRGMHASADGSAAGGSAAVVVNDGANATAIRDVVTTALDLNVKAVAAAAPPQFVSIKSYLDGWFKLGPVVLWQQTDVKNIIFDRDTGILADKTTYRPSAVQCGTFSYQDADEEKSKDPFFRILRATGLKYMRERWFARRRIFRLSMGERDDGIITQKTNIYEGFPCYREKEKQIKKYEKEMVDICKLMDNYEEKNLNTTELESKFSKLAKPYDKLMYETGMNGAKNRWQDRGEFVWGLADHVRSYFDHKNLYYFSDAHFVDQSLPTNIFNFHVDIHSIFDLNFHSSKNSVKWDKNTTPDISAVTLLYVDHEHKPIVNGVQFVQDIGSGKLSETFRYSEVGDTYIFPCNVIHRTVLETPLSCALSQAPENEKTIKLFKDFLERKSQFREHGAIVKVAFFYKKKISQWESNPRC